MKTVRYILIVSGALLIADTFFAMTRSNLNLGVIMPACIGLPMLLYGVFYSPIEAFCAGGVGIVLKGVVFAAYIIFFAVFITCIVLMSTAKRADPDDEYDAVIVLGAAVHGDEMSLMLKKRTQAAVEYLCAHPGAICVLSGGQGSAENIPEAHAMRSYVLSRGIAPERVIAEDRARSTRENFVFSKRLLDERLGSYRAVYVTSDEHIYRAGIEARRAGLDIAGIGVEPAFYMAPNFYLRETAAIVHSMIFG